MKKTMVYILALLMLVGLLGGCGDRNNDGSNDDNNAVPPVTNTPADNGVIGDNDIIPDGDDMMPDPDDGIVGDDDGIITDNDNNNGNGNNDGVNGEDNGANDEGIVGDNNENDTDDVTRSRSRTSTGMR